MCYRSDGKRCRGERERTSTRVRCLMLESCGDDDSYGGSSGLKCRVCSKKYFTIGVPILPMEVRVSFTRMY